MPELTPSTVTPPDTSEDDPRLGHLLGGTDRDATDATTVLLGFPVDEGVVRNGGRPGAADAPDRLRQWLYRMTPDARRHGAFVDLLRHTIDLGDLSTDASLATLQSHLGEILGPHLRQGRVPITLGGGHETAYGHFLGYVEAGQDVSILNWDAHADVRATADGRPHSGSPFRQALQHPSGRCRHYTVAGLLPHSTAPAHLHFVEEHDGRYLWSDDLSRDAVTTLYDRASTPLMVTFDLDALDQSHAPGVSAPAAGGLSQDLWLHAAYWAGRSPTVTSIDVVELNPTVDVDDRTARLAALTVLEVLRGLTDRLHRG
jgi:formiminoglutamase